MTITAKIIADSITEDGNRLTTMQLMYPRFIHSEFMTHRTFCIAGSARLDFDLPTPAPGQARKMYSMTIAEFVDKWHNGAAKSVASRHNGQFLNSIDDHTIYSAREISNILGHKHALNINAACRNGFVVGATKVGRVWTANGSAWKAWRNASGYRSFSVRKRLARMRIRQVNEVTGAVVSAHVTDCVYSGSKTTYRLRAGSYTTVATADHRIFTDAGWLRVGDLIPGESKVLTYKYGSGGNPDRFKKIDGVWVSQWAKQVKRDVSDRQMGCCAISGDPLPQSFHIHHVIPRHERPDLAFDVDNVIAVTPNSHRKMHATQGWQEGVPLLTEFATVDSVELECVQDTYDLSISGEFENFFADGIVVHNSRNASSSRAIPISKMIQSIRDNPAMPIHWGKNQAGMQADEELDVPYKEQCQVLWLWAMDDACRNAAVMEHMGAHKQIVNRLLEPFQHIHVVVTATEWDNFFALRHHPKAQPEFQELAMKMQAAYASNVPKLVAFGDWHLPYTDESDGTVRRRIIKSAASCARVSYTNHEGKESTEEEDSNLYLRLVTADPPHMSPVEHQAMAVPGDKFYANFRGWRQHRYDLERNQVS
jgi:hypothetical protein